MAPFGDDATLGSGLPDRMVLTVASAKIDTPYEKNPTQIAVVLTGEADVDGEKSDEHLWMKPGTQFEPGDKDGSFLVHTTQKPDIFDDPSSKKKKINKNSSYGKFLSSALAADQAALEANQDPAREKFSIWDVKFWEGLVLDVEVVEEPYSFKDDAGELVEGKSRQPYVRAILGAGRATAAAAPAASANGTVDPKEFDSYMKYVEAYIKAGGSTSDDAAGEEHYKKARA